ncbi:CHY zinc finger domain protein [Dendryphion nanum]|uniref:CHY zinc finger domain protein n=1 Tax=Dendryphion nanum TaxID=256645 RepID=A0A9P9DHT5_9PLEO|nr:CHY zinc finger domain protein [Dendryphion nanum]
MLQGCRSGAACPFRHEVVDTGSATAHQQSTAALQDHPVRTSQQQQQQHSRRQPLPPGPLQQSVAAGNSPIAPSGRTTARQQPAVNTSRITHRPVPPSQLADPRAYQVSQVRRRFPGLDERNENDSTVLTFRLPPSDPDFPFDLDALHCSLRIPFNYPNGGGKPSLRVTNPDMERGFQINIERGFDKIVAETSSSTLLASLNALDKHLESLLSTQKADTIKIVSHSAKPKSLGSASVAPLLAPYAPVGVPPPAPLFPSTATPVQSPAQPPPRYSAEEKASAKIVRDAQTRQIEARMGRLPHFSKSPDGSWFNIPFEPARKKDLPVELKAIKLVKLIVPGQYNLLPCSVQLIGVAGSAVQAVEDAFRLRARQSPQLSLLNHINFLSQNIVVMAKSKPETNVKQETEITSRMTLPERPKGEQVAKVSSPLLPTADVPDRPHIITIPRPPEWDSGMAENADSMESSSESDDESDDHEDESMSHQSAPTPSATTTQERGVLVSFPRLDLHGVELIEIGTLNITVKCDRCKDSKDVNGLQNNSDGNHTRSDTCKKCAAPFTIGYRAELMHVNSVRAGYLDLEGCTIVDMLPSSFIPTCAECSTTYPRTGVMSVRGDSSMAFCRECHRKMTFGLPEIKFLRVSAKTERASLAPARKKRPENLGIVAGQELPSRGRCSHYKKSYRWFRFSCCDKVFPCDRCHDQVADHTIEHANRMICGFCSREQNYRPKDCGICHAFLTIRPGKGFWEGGQGTCAFLSIIKTKFGHHAWVITTLIWWCAMVAQLSCSCHRRSECSSSG